MKNEDIFEYIMDLYSKFVLNRQTFLDDKYERNFNAYHKKDDTEFTGTDDQSHIYIDIVKQKVVAGSNLVSDMAFKNGIVPFVLEDPLTVDGLPSGDDYAMETLIKRQLLLANAKAEMEKVVLSGSLYGEGYAKFYISEETDVGYHDIGDNFVEVPLDVADPKVSAVSVWDIFRDLETDDIQNSEGIIERSYVTISDLEEYRSDPHVILTNLNRALDSRYINESSQNDNPLRRNVPSRVRSIEKLECWVKIPEKSRDNDKKMIYCKAVLAAGELLTFVRIENWDIPYYRFEWEANIDGHGGIGTADNIGDLQGVLNTAFRTYEDNKHLASRVLFAGVSSYIKNFSDGLKTGGFLEIADVDDVREAVNQFTVADVGENLISLINLTLQMADMSSNIPRTSQGQESSNPQTAYEIQQRLERAGKYIGRVMSNLDYLIEAVVDRFYRWNMTDPSVPYASKTPYRVQSTGFASYETRMIRTQKLMTTLQIFTQNPDLASQFKLDWLVGEISKSNDIDPRLIIKSPEEKQADAENQQAQQAEQQKQFDLQLEKQSVDIQKVYAEIKEILNEVEEKRLAGAREELGANAERDVQEGSGQ